MKQKTLYIVKAKVVDNEGKAIGTISYDKSYATKANASKVAAKLENGKISEVFLDETTVESIE